MLWGIIRVDEESPVCLKIPGTKLGRKDLNDSVAPLVTTAHTYELDTVLRVLLILIPS